MTAEELAQRLERIEQLLLTLMSPPVTRDFYSTAEAAKRLGLSPWYVRRLCATGEILAEKHPESGRFLISANELERLVTRRNMLDDR